MKIQYIVPDMAQSLGTLEFVGESNPVFDRDRENRRFFAKRSYNLYSDVQKDGNIVVEIPVQAGEKHFKYEQKVNLSIRSYTAKVTQSGEIWDIPIICCLLIIL